MTPLNQALNGTIERIVDEACLPGDEARDDLRRELASYFEEAEAADDSPEESMARFGSPAEISQNFQEVYRGAFVWWLSLRLIAAVLLGGAVSEAFLALTHLRLSPDHGLQLSASFFHAYGFGIKLALGLAAAWEMGRKPFRLTRAIGAFAAYCAIATGLQAFVFNGLHGWEPWHTPSLIALGFVASRLRPSVMRMAVMFVLFFSYMAATSSQGLPSRLALAVALVVIWTLTERLFAKLDERIEAWFQVPMESALISPGENRRAPISVDHPSGRFRSSPHI